MKRVLLFIILLSSFFTLNSFAQTRLSGGQAYGWYVIDPPTIPGTPDFSDVFFTDDNTGWITSSSTNNIFKTADGTASFSTQITTLTTNAVHMVDANTGFSGGASGFVYSTIDGGLNWPFFGTISNTLTDIEFATTTQGYACGFNGTIYSVTPGGVSPMTANVGTINLASITFPTTTEGWACGEAVIVHYSGGTWSTDQTHPSGSYNGIDFVDNNTGWAVGDNGRIIHTTDGQNWTEQQTNPAYILLDVFFLTPSEGWAVGSGGTILHTVNGGTTWTLEGAGLTNAILREVHFTNSNNGYVVGNGKTIVKFGEITSVEGGNISPGAFSLLQNYPNPFNPSTNIKFTISDFGFVNLKVYDLLGNEITTLVNEEKLAGEYEVEFNPVSSFENPASGIYFYQIKAGSFIETKKMVFMK